MANPKLKPTFAIHILINALELFNSLGINFISYNENIDTSSPAGKVLFTLISAFAEFERAIISERVKSGLVKAKAKGKRLGRPIKEVDVIDVKDMRENGLSIRAIANKLCVSKSMIHSLLKN